MIVKRMGWVVGITMLCWGSMVILGSFQSVPERTMSEAIGTILNTHVDPQILNDDYSKRVFALYIKRLDPGKRLFTQADINRLRAFELTLDDAVRENDERLAVLAHEILTQRIAEAQATVTAYQDTPHQFEVPEWLETDFDQRAYPANDADFKDEWRRFVKHQVLMGAMTAIESQAATQNPQTIEDPAVEAEARRKVALQMVDYFKRLKSDTLAKRTQWLIDAMAGAFDPHTAYMAPEDRNEFDIGIKGSLEGIGAVLQEENGTIKITRVVPGSPSARSKKMAAQDVILKVTQANGDTTDMAGLSVMDAVKVIRGKKGTEVTLTIKSPDGKVSVVTLVRDVIQLEESYAKSAVVSLPNGDRVGYLYLPGFYRDFNDSNARNAADDVKQILASFQRQGITAMVFDLRNNGGGALDDAVKVAGLLIESGPVVQVRDRFNRRYVYTDYDRGVAFTGQVVVLVNTFSASASEIVAGALQDYGRALIVGGQHTYGKGTVQQLLSLPVDRMGSVKVTNQKYYRVTGASTQFKGVVPDIIVPQSEDYLEVGEEKLPYALDWSSTTPQSFTPWPHTVDRDEVAKRSAARIAQSSPYAGLQDYITRYQAHRKQSKVTLQASQAIAQQKLVRSDAALLDRFKVTQPEMTAQVDMPTSSDTDRQAALTQWAQQLVTDPHITEAIHIVLDMSHATGGRVVDTHR